MRPFYDEGGVTIYNGDCREVLPGLTADVIVTDPPYGLAFMGKAWDKPYCSKFHRGWAEKAFQSLPAGGWLLAFGGTRTWHRFAVGVEDAGFEVRDTLMWLYGSGFPKGKACLKPGWEPILLARKPGSNVLQIDACRIGIDPGEGGNLRRAGQEFPSNGGSRNNAVYGADSSERGGYYSPSGRWPANVVLDVVAADLLDQQSGESRSSGGTGLASGTPGGRGIYGTFGRAPDGGANIGGLGDRGGASRFFYTAKAGRSERVKVDGEQHPTVKPLALMRWLVRLVTPPGGTVLDPFCGSGSTLVAAALEGCKAIGIEADEQWCRGSAQRVSEVPPVQEVLNLA